MGDRTGSHQEDEKRGEGGVDRMRLIVRIQANIRRYRTVAALSHHSEKRRMVVQEIYETEQAYVNNLRSMIQHYDQPLRTLFKASLLSASSAPLSEQQIDLFFAEIPTILESHDQGVKLMSSKLARWSMLQGVADVFTEMSRQCRSAYRVYANRYPTVTAVLRVECESEELSKFLLEAQRRSFNKFALADLLIMPIQRVPQILLLLTRLRQLTSVSHPDCVALDSVIEDVRELASYINQQQQEGLRRQDVLRLQEQLLRNGYDFRFEDQSIVSQQEVVIINQNRARELRTIILLGSKLLCARIEKTPLAMRLVRGTDVTIELDWALDHTGYTYVSMKDRCMGSSGRDMKVVAAEIAKLEKQCEVERKIIESGKRMSHIYASAKDISHSGWAKIEVEEAESRLSTASRELASLKSDFALENPTYGVQIHITNGPSSGATVIILHDTIEERDRFYKELHANAVDSHRPTLFRSQTEMFATAENKALMWHIAPDSATQASVASVLSLTAVPGMERLSKLTFTIEKNAPSTGIVRKPSALQVKASPTPSKAKASLSVRWNADVVMVSDDERSIVHVSILNHAIVCGVPAIATDAKDLEGVRFRLEWIIPLALTVSKAVDLPTGTGHNDPKVIEERIADIQTQISKETAMLTASYKMAGSSATIKKTPSMRLSKGPDLHASVKELNANSAMRIEQMRQRVAPLQHALAMNTAVFGAQLTVVGSKREVMLAFSTEGARALFLERLATVQRTSVQRFARAAKRMSTERRRSTSVVPAELTAEETAELAEQIRVSMQAGRDSQHLYTAAADHLAETEDELMFLVGERVDVLAKLTEDCWLCVCEGVFGVVAPRLLLPLHLFGLDYIPQFRKSTTKKYTARVATAYEEPHFLDLAPGDVVHLFEQELPKRQGLWLGKSKGVIGLVAREHLMAEK